MKHFSQMQRRLRAICLTMLVLVLLFSLAVSAHAQSGGGYDLTWSTIDGGGATWSTGDGYSLGGTIGQPDAGAMTGTGYTLCGGFWGGVKALFYRYMPVTLKN